MRISIRLLAALFAVTTIVPWSVVRADDDEKPAAKADKPAEKAPPTDVTTPGALDAGGQHIAYELHVVTPLMKKFGDRIRHVLVDQEQHPRRSFRWCIHATL